MGEFPIFGKFPDGKIDAAIGAFIGETFFDQSLNQPDHLRNIIGGAPDSVRPFRFEAPPNLRKRPSETVRYIV